MTGKSTDPVYMPHEAKTVVTEKREMAEPAEKIAISHEKM